jgi:spectinomycin phosphotransferase
VWGPRDTPSITASAPRTYETEVETVNTPPPVGLEEHVLADALDTTWNLAVDRLDYIPKGFGSYHWHAQSADGQDYFVTADDLDTKPWLGANHEAALEGLEAAYDTASILHAQAHLPFVVAPIPGVNGGVILQVTPRYSIAVFPFVEGNAGDWGDPIGPEDRHHLMRVIAELHRCSPFVASRAPHRGVTLPGRTGLEAALGELDQVWSGGPFSEPARGELANHAHEVRRWLASFDDLADRVSRSQAQLVVTHGETHPGNLIRSSSGLLLVDWDTVALAWPERDLWMLDDGTADAFAAYSEASGRAVDSTAIAFYRQAWNLTDIAAFTALVRSQHTKNQDTEKAWRGLTDALRARASTPYSIIGTNSSPSSEVPPASGA